jgi:sec-independent protein translocase protein TatA
LSSGKAERPTPKRGYSKTAKRRRLGWDIGEFSPGKIVLLLVLALLLFGAKRLPEIGRSLGSGMREFKDSLTGVKDSLSLEESSVVPPAVPAAPEDAATGPHPIE